MDDVDYSKASNYSYAKEADSSFLDTTEGHDEILKTPNKRIWLIVFMGVISLVSAFFFYILILNPIVNKEDQNKDLLFLYKLIFYTFNGCYIYSMVWLSVHYFSARYLSKNGSTFTSLILKSKMNQIIMSIFLFFLYLFIKIYEHILLKKNIAIAIGDDPQVQKLAANLSNEAAAEVVPSVVKFDLKVFLIENFSLIILGVSLVMFLALLKSIILEGIDYMMYWSTYFQKVIKTNEDIKVLHLINKITGRTMSLRSSEWVSYVFKILSPEGSPFNRATIEYFFTPEETDLIMALFDTRGTGIIDEEHFVTTWLNVSSDKKKIKNVIEYKNALLKKLDYLISFIFIPVMLFAFMAILGKTEHFKTYGSLVLGFILPLSFIFSGVIGDLFKSIIYVFFVRPFEVGDTIEIEDKIYIVDEIGLLYSSFLRQSLNVSISNIELMSKNIANFRRSELYEKKYVLELDLMVYKREVENFKTKIKDLVAANPTLLKKKFKLHDISVKNNEKIEVTLVIYANIHSHNLTEGIDNFSIKLDQVVSEIKKSKVDQEEDKENREQ